MPGRVFLKRQALKKTLTIVANTCESDVLNFGEAAGMVLKIGAVHTTGSLGFRVADTEAGSFVDLRQANSTLVEAVTSTVGVYYAAPVEVFAFKYVRLWSQAAGVDVDQAADCAITVILKG